MQNNISRNNSLNCHLFSTFCVCSNLLLAEWLGYITPVVPKCSLERCSIFNVAWLFIGFQGFNSLSCIPQGTFPSELAVSNAQVSSNFEGQSASTSEITKATRMMMMNRNSVRSPLSRSSQTSQPKLLVRTNASQTKSGLAQVSLQILPSIHGYKRLRSFPAVDFSPPNSPPVSTRSVLSQRWSAY